MFTVDQQWSRTRVTQGAIQPAGEDVPSVFLSLPVFHCGMRLICVCNCFLGKLDLYNLVMLAESLL